MGARGRAPTTGVRMVVAAMLLASAVNAAPVRAGGLVGSAAVLGDAGGSVSWGGLFRDAAAPSEPRLYGVPGSCVHLGCDESTLDVALPAGVWAGSPGGVQIAIDWPDEENDLELYVYGPDGSLAGRSDGIVSTGESVRPRDAANGRYRVVVVPQVVHG